MDLIGTRSNFGHGSRIIVTSRDKQVLKNANVDEIYHVVEMDGKDSLRLFCLNAFKQIEPIENYLSLTKKVLNYSQGVPLTLIVLGLFLQSRAKEAWESELQKLEKSLEPKIFNVLKLSYDGLDDEQKDIFLDIACFCRGETEKCVVHTLDSYGISTRIGMDVLQDRCLISILEGRVWMHDQIQEMGHEIVRQENVNHPEKRSRLHKPDDIYEVLKKNKGHGTDSIQSILLDACKIKKVQLHAETFKKMHNLRMIRIYGSYEFKKFSNVTFHTILNSFPDNLKFLGWNDFPQRSLPQDFCPDNLVALDMYRSNLEQLWERDQTLPNLKRLNLSYSVKMIGVPDLSLFPNIEEILLSGCVSLEQVYSSSFLHKLNSLCLNDCTSLKSVSIRSNILSRSTGLVALQHCHNLETILFTSATDVVQSYSCFDDKTVMESKFKGGYRFGYAELQLFQINSDLCSLDLSYCKSLASLPAELINLKLLTRLNPYSCLKLEELPEIEDTMDNLKVLNLHHTAIKELPSSLHRLVGLEELSLHGCRKLKTIPSSIGNLSKLLKLDLSYCESLETFPSSIFKLKLTKLDFLGCSMLRTFPEIPLDIGRLSSLTEISLRRTNIVNLLESMVHLSSLKSLNLSDCKSLERIPSSIGNLSKLLLLDLSYCASLTCLPAKLLNLKFLTSLCLTCCFMLEELPEIEDSMVNLKVLKLDYTKIKELPSLLHHLVGLEELTLRGCAKLKTIPSSIGNLSKLLKLDLRYCESLKTFPSSIFKLKLTKLDFLGCSMLRTFPEIPREIGRVSSLTEISLQGSNIVNLPESMAHLSSLKSLNLSDCKSLLCIPKLPLCLGKLLAFDCTSIKKVVPNLLLKLMSDSNDEMDGLCEFHLTNSEALEASSWSYILNEALIKIIDNAYPSAFFCFPGSRVPDWFIPRCQGHSITVKNDLGSENRLIGFALCFVFRDVHMDGTRTRVGGIKYRLSFISDGKPFVFHENLNLNWEYHFRSFIQDHTFLWKYQLDRASIGNNLIHAQSFTFEILGDDYVTPSDYQFNVMVKECGVRPLHIPKNRMPPIFELDS